MNFVQMFFCKTLRLHFEIKLFKMQSILILLMRDLYFKTFTKNQLPSKLP